VIKMPVPFTWIVPVTMISAIGYLRSNLVGEGRRKSSNTVQKLQRA
jgi:hypothetical protein